MTCHRDHLHAVHRAEPSRPNQADATHADTSSTETRTSGEEPFVNAVTTHNTIAKPKRRKRKRSNSDSFVRAVCNHYCQAKHSTTATAPHAHTTRTREPTASSTRTAT